MAGGEVRIGAGQERFLGNDVVALVGDKAEDAAIRAGKAVPAPVATKEIALIGFGEGRTVVADQLGVGAAVELITGGRQRMIAGQPVVIDGAPAVAVIIDAVENADET